MITLFQRDRLPFTPHQSAMEQTEDQDLTCMHREEVFLDRLPFNELEEAMRNDLCGLLAQPHLLHYVFAVVIHS